jgi:hypothetical protein
VALAEIVKFFTCTASDFDDRLLYRRKAFRIVKYHTLGMVRTPQAAGKRISERMNDVDVNEPVVALIAFDPVTVIASM